MPQLLATLLLPGTARSPHATTAESRDTEVDYSTEIVGHPDNSVAVLIKHKVSSHSITILPGFGLIVLRPVHSASSWWAEDRTHDHHLGWR